MDEIQKNANWSEVVKELWDEDRYRNNALHVVEKGFCQVPETDPRPENAAELQERLEVAMPPNLRQRFPFA